MDTYGQGLGCYLPMQNDNNLIAYDSNNIALWESNNSKDNGNYVLVLCIKDRVGEKQNKVRKWGNYRFYE